MRRTENTGLPGVLAFAGMLFIAAGTRADDRVRFGWETSDGVRAADATIISEQRGRSVVVLSNPESGSDLAFVATERKDGSRLLEIRLLQTADVLSITLPGSSRRGTEAAEDQKEAAAGVLNVNGLEFPPPPTEPDARIRYTLELRQAMTATFRNALEWSRTYLGLESLRPFCPLLGAALYGEPCRGPENPFVRKPLAIDCRRDAKLGFPCPTEDRKR